MSAEVYRDYFNEEFSKYPRDPAREDRVINYLGNIDSLGPLISSSPANKDFLEHSASQVLKNIGLPAYSPVFIDSLEAGNNFTYLVDIDLEWSAAWGVLRKNALSYIQDNDYLINLWTTTSGLVYGNLQEEDDKPDKVTSNIIRRASAYCQWGIVENEMGPNKLAPFVDSYKSGHPLLGVAQIRGQGLFGILTPTP